MTEDQNKVVEESVLTQRFLVLQNLINDGLTDGWLEGKPELVEQAIKLFTPPPPKYSKTHTYAKKDLVAAEYERSLQTGEPVKPITEEQVLAEVERRKKAKQANASKKAE